MQNQCNVGLVRLNCPLLVVAGESEQTAKLQNISPARRTTADAAMQEQEQTISSCAARCLLTLNWDERHRVHLSKYRHFLRWELGRFL